MSASDVRTHNAHVLLISGICFAVMVLGFIFPEVAQIMNDSGWLLLGLVNLERMK